MVDGGTEDAGGYKAESLPDKHYTKVVQGINSVVIDESF